MKRHCTLAIAVLALALPLDGGSLAARETANRAGGQALGTGIASYYGNEFVGRRTASGEPYRSNAYTAAHRSAALGSRIRVRNLGNGREVVVRINDRGPWGKGRIIDLSWAAANKIGLIRTGTARVSLSLLD